MGAFRGFFVVLSLAVGLIAADSPFSGTWKLVPSKGHSTKATAKVEADEHNFRVNHKTVDEKGRDRPARNEAASIAKSNHFAAIHTASSSSAHATAHSK